LNPWPVRRWALLVGLLCTGLSAGCRREGHRDRAARRAGPPNIILLVIDTARADRFGFLGCARRTTPEIDAFAADCVAYPNAHSVAPWTLPAHMSMFTGLLPGEHGATWRAFSEPAEMTLAEIMVRSYTPPDPQRLLPFLLKQAGYITIGISQNPWVSERNGFAQGFDHFVEAWRSRAGLGSSYEWLPRKLKTTPEADSGPAGRSLLLFKQYFDAHDVAEPFFAFFNLIDPHFPYLPPGSFARRFDGDPRIIPEMLGDETGTVELALIAGGRHIDPAALTRFYDAELYYVDFIVGKLMEWLRDKDYYDDALIILTSDHGEHLGAYGRYSHQLSVEEGLLRVPLLIKYPGGRGAGSRVSDPLVSNLDVYRTILSAARCDPSSEIPPDRSYDLAQMDRFDRTELVAEDYYSEAYLRQLQQHSDNFDIDDQRLVRRAVYTHEGKYVFEDDRLETVEAIGPENAPAADEQPRADMIARMHDYIQAVDETARTQAAPAEPDPDLIEKLRSLGYVDPQRTRPQEVPSEKNSPD
jgi:arylsulfatase A-like enzyme